MKQMKTTNLQPSNPKRKTIRRLRQLLFLILLGVIGFIGYRYYNLSQEHNELLEAEQSWQATQASLEAMIHDQQEALGEQSSQPINLEQALGQFDFQTPETFEAVKRFAELRFGRDWLKNQPTIVELLEDKNLIQENFGYAFLPANPSKYTKVSESAYQIDVPLLLQSDPRWSRVHYGSEEYETIRIGGCAIVSLAMVEAAFGDASTTPDDILKWAKTDYWVDHDGTSWQIFEDFAKKYGYEMTDHGDELDAALAASEEGEIVVASISPGFMTEVGHIFVIRGYDPEDEVVLVNDPNDNPVNMFSLHGVEAHHLREEGRNYWSYRKK